MKIGAGHIIGLLLVTAVTMQGIILLRPVWTKSRSAAPLPRQLDKTVDVSNLPLLGSPDTGIVLVEFMDYECPFCKRYASEVFPALKDRFVSTGKIRYGSMNLPLDFHPNAKQHATAAFCARMQGQFWEMHDYLMGSPKLPPDISRQFDGLIQGIRLNAMTFRHCMEEAAGPQKQIEADLDTAKNLGLSATPSFALGKIGADNRLNVTKVIVGAQPIDVFSKAIEELILKEL